MSETSKLIHKWWFWAIIAVALVSIVSSFSNDNKECPVSQNQTCPPCLKYVEQYNQTYIKYQCSDGSIKDNLADCPSSSQTSVQADSNPKSLDGSGSQVTDKFYLNQGLAIFRSDYSGEGNFIVYLIDESGNQIDLVANEIGTSQSSSSSKIARAGYYRLDVNGWTGSSWSIKVEQ